MMRKQIWRNLWLCLVKEIPNKSAHLDQIKNPPSLRVSKWLLWEIFNNKSVQFQYSVQFQKKISPWSAYLFNDAIKSYFMPPIGGSVTSHFHHEFCLKSYSKNPQNNQNVCWVGWNNRTKNKGKTIFIS